jgi:hypothetical protein
MGEQMVAWLVEVVEAASVPPVYLNTWLCTLGVRVVSVCMRVGCGYVCVCRVFGVFLFWRLFVFSRQECERATRQSTRRER